MKKVFLMITIFLFILLSFLKINIFAQEDVFNKFNIYLPGINCGDPNSEVNNRCCTYNISDADFIPPNLGPLQGLYDGLSFFTKYNFDKFIKPLNIFFENLFYKKRDILVCQSGSIPSTSDFNDPNCRCIKSGVEIDEERALKALEIFCQKQSNSNQAIQCLECINKSGVWTGLGCVYTDIKYFIQETIFKLAIGLAGGFALLCIIYAAFMMQSSQGNPEKLKKAQEMITSCIMGLMLIIFSVFILKLIGINILQIPGFK